MTRDPGGLLGAARGLLDRADDVTAALWPRAAALLSRQALEEALQQHWTRRAPKLLDCSTRAQLLCLGETTRSHELPRLASHAWWALSRACHQHPYELPPTVEELSLQIDAVQNVVDEISRTCGP